MIRIGESLPPLRDDEADLAAHVADLAAGALGSSEPGVVCEVCALLLAGVMQPRAVADPDGIEQLILTLVNDVVQRIDAHTAASVAIMKAMGAAKRR